MSSYLYVLPVYENVKNINLKWSKYFYHACSITLVFRTPIFIYFVLLNKFYRIKEEWIRYNTVIKTVGRRIKKISNIWINI